MAGENLLRAQCSTGIVQWEPSFDSTFWADTYAVKGEMWAPMGHLTWTNVLIFLKTCSSSPSAIRTAMVEVMIKGENKAFESLSVHLLLLSFLLAAKGEVPLKHWSQGKRLLFIITCLCSSNYCASVLQTAVNMN